MSDTIDPRAAAEEALRLHEAATPGPWSADEESEGVWLVDNEQLNVATVPAKDDAAFIAGSRTLLPILARAVIEGQSRPAPALDCRGCGETGSVELGAIKLLCHQCRHAGLTHELVDKAEAADPAASHLAQATEKARELWNAVRGLLDSRVTTYHGDGTATVAGDLLNALDEASEAARPTTEGE